LFLPYVEDLKSLINHVQQEGELQGVKIGRGAPTVTNLLFADDLLMLLQENEENETCVKNNYELVRGASGQLVSDGKSCIFFTPNIAADIRARVCTILNIVIESLTDKYLGLPTQFRGDKSDYFNTCWIACANLLKDRRRIFCPREGRRCFSRR
jgi:hypothetical protein